MSVSLVQICPTAVFFAGCSGDLLVVAHFQCRLRPVGRDARSPFHRGGVDFTI